MSFQQGKKTASIWRGVVLGHHAESRSRVRSEVAHCMYLRGAPVLSPSPLPQGGEGRGEESRFASKCSRVSAGCCPSPRPSPRSFLTGRGRFGRALNQVRSLGVAILLLGL